MYPDPLFWDISLYEIMFFLGLVAALVVFTIYTNKKGMPAKAQSFYQNLAIVAMAGGYLFAFLFQAVYNYFETGKFEFVGITFLGGLAGGAFVFLLGYKLFAKEAQKNYFHLVVQSAPCCILIAHAIGRIGCFFAGCCYGIETDSFLGVHFHSYPANQLGFVFPTQLFESAFLFVMFAVTSWLYFKEKKINFTVYLLSYGAFRFLIEFIRGDDRGQFIISFLSPSQVLSLIMVIAAVLLIAFKKKI
jgi:phosphatidylglycerol:prolipoprotein diacylglycerol transferase